jgi:hypothetical protein
MSSGLFSGVTVSPTVLVVTPAIGPIVIMSTLQISVVAQIVSVS